jgi:hypothetical protein
VGAVSGKRCGRVFLQPPELGGIHPNLLAGEGPEGGFCRLPRKRCLGHRSKKRKKRKGIGFITVPQSLSQITSADGGRIRNSAGGIFQQGPSRVSYLRFNDLVVILGVHIGVHQPYFPIENDKNRY